MCGALRAGRAYCKPYVSTLATVRSKVLARLAELGRLAEAPSADGAFYCFLRVRTSMDSMTLARRLIVEHKIATAPGAAFGLGDGCYLRLSYGALAPETVDEGMGRLIEGLRTIVG